MKNDNGKCNTEYFSFSEHLTIQQTRWMLLVWEE